MFSHWLAFYLLENFELGHRISSRRVGGKWPHSLDSIRYGLHTLLSDVVTEPASLSKYRGSKFFSIKWSCKG